MNSEEDCSPQDVKRLGLLLNFLKKSTENGVPPEMENSILGMLNTIISSSHLVIEHNFPKLKRLTINRNVLKTNKRIYDIKYLKYPPKEFVTKYGRCNLPNQSILYAAFDIITVVSELNPKIGDLITVSTWKAKNKATPLIVAPIFKRQPTGGIVNISTRQLNELYLRELAKYPKNKVKEIDLLNEFIADEYTKPVSPNKHFDYIFSAYFTDRIFRELNNANVEAVYYPSVKQDLSFENLAIKPTVFDLKYEIIKVEESMVIHDLTSGTGAVRLCGLSSCKNFDAAGKILWSGNFTQPDSTINKFKELYCYEV